MAFTKVVGAGIHTLSNITSHNINSSGIITATKFVGPFDGTSGTFSGNVTIGGNLSVAQTVTYEDVKNVDSVGVITARSNIDCNGSLDVDGHTNLDNVSVAGVTTITGTGTNGLFKVERVSGAGLHIQAQSALGVFGTTSNHNLRLISNGNERILLSTNGNIGINDSSPDTRLSVTAASGTDVVGKFTSTDARAWIQLRDNSTTDTGVMLGAEGDDMLLRAGSNTRLRITSGGNVNIGTSELDQTARKFNVYGGAARVTQTSGGNTIEVFGGTTSGQSYGLLVNAGSTSADYCANFRDKDGTSILRIRGDGNVGIGSDNPESTLTILKNSSSDGPVIRLRNPNGGDGTYIGRIQCADAANAFYTGINFFKHDTDDGEIRFRTKVAGTNTDVLTIVDGKIGINQTSPTAELEVCPINTTVDTAVIFINAKTHDTNVASEAILKFGYGHSGDPDAVGHIKLVENGGNNFDGDLIFGLPTNNSAGGSVTNERFRIRYNGQVSISDAGNTFGNARLNIRPTNRTTAFSASDGDTWHDFVLMQGGGATNNAVGIAFEIEDGGSYHKNAGTGICAVKNGTNSDYGSDLVFITRPQSAVAQERLRIRSTGQVRLPINGQELTWGSSQQMKFYYDNSEERMYLQGDGAYGFAFRINSGNRIEIDKTTGDVTMQGASGRNFQWDNSEASLYLTDNGSGSSGRLKIGSGGDLQLYHDVSGNLNHVVAATNGEIKFSANEFSFYDYSGVTERARLKSTGEFHISDRNSSNTGDHFFQAGAFGIRMEDTGGYNRWNIERNYGGFQSTPLVHLSAQGRVGINQVNPSRATLHVVGGTANPDIVAKFKGSSGADARTKIGIAAAYSDTANDTEGQVYIGALRGGSGNSSRLFFEVSSGTTLKETVRVDESGVTAGGSYRFQNGTRTGTEMPNSHNIGDVSSNSISYYHNAGIYYVYLTCPTDGNWYTMMTSFNDSASNFRGVCGDASSKNSFYWYFNPTSPSYGVNPYGEKWHHGAWNTGSVTFRLDGTHPNWNLQIKCTSHYGTSRTAALRGIMEVYY